MFVAEKEDSLHSDLLMLVDRVLFFLLCFFFKLNDVILCALSGDWKDHFHCMSGSGAAWRDGL